MTKINDIKINVSNEVKSIFAEIQKLKKIAAEKVEGLKILERDHAKKKREVDFLKRAADKALEANSSPMKHIEKLAVVEAELKTIESLLPNEFSQPDHAETAQITELERQLSHKLRVEFNSSEFKLKTQCDLKEKLIEIKKLFSKFDSAQSELFDSFQIPIGQNKLTLVIDDDAILGRWVRTELGNLIVANERR